MNGESVTFLEGAVYGLRLASETLAALKLGGRSDADFQIKVREQIQSIESVIDMGRKNESQD